LSPDGSGGPDPIGRTIYFTPCDRTGGYKSGWSAASLNGVSKPKDPCGFRPGMKAARFY